MYALLDPSRRLRLLIHYIRIFICVYCALRRTLSGPIKANVTASAPHRHPTAVVVVIVVVVVVVRLQDCS